MPWNRINYYPKRNKVSNNEKSVNHAELWKWNEQSFISTAATDPFKEPVMPTFRIKSSYSWEWGKRWGRQRGRGFSDLKRNYGETLKSSRGQKIQMRVVLCLVLTSLSSLLVAVLQVLVLLWPVLRSVSQQVHTAQCSEPPAAVLIWTRACSRLPFCFP